MKWRKTWHKSVVSLATSEAWHLTWAMKSTLRTSRLNAFRARSVFGRGSETSLLQEKLNLLILTVLLLFFFVGHGQWVPHQWGQSEGHKANNKIETWDFFLNVYSLLGKCVHMLIQMIHLLNDYLQNLDYCLLMWQYIIIIICSNNSS